MAEKILEIKNLVTRFKTDKGSGTVVNGVSFDVHKGKILGIVGESGSGKSVTALSIMRLIGNMSGSIDQGKIIFEGQDILQLSNTEMRAIRGNKISMIFQEPMTSLNPVYTVGNQVREVLVLHQNMTTQAAKEKSIALLDLVGIPAPEKRVNEYPHQLSGGMRQRVMIALSLACKPAVLIADEPTTALDVTIQAQILDLMKKLQEEIGMGIIFITHDLGVVAEICDEVAVMYAGNIVEKATVATLFSQPKHPYTQGLIASMPSLATMQCNATKKLTTIEGTVPSLFALPQGCNFQDRCQWADRACKGMNGAPVLEEMAINHHVACFHPLNQPKTIQK